MIENLKKIDYRHYICSAISLLFILLAIFYFRYGGLRIAESLYDIFTSSKYYINELLELNLNGEITINNFTNQPFVLPFNLPNTWEEFKVLWKTYWQAFINIEYVKAYFSYLGNLLINLSKLLTILMPFAMIIMLLLNRQAKINNDYNKDTKALKLFKKFEKRFYLPVKYWLLDFIQFIKENPIYSKIWILTWCYSFNFIAIIIEAIAYYLYFIASFDFVSLYIQVLKLLMDLSIVIDFLPIFAWIIIAILLIHRFRTNVGYDNLNHYERKDRGFINDRPIVIMLCGTMGKKKTTMITDIALSQEIMLRDKAFEKILECDLKFPYFPWINLENSLKKAIKNHSVYNLATCKRFVKSKQKKFMKNKHMKNLFHYNFNQYPYFYNDQLKVIDIWEVIENYCQLYFVYIIQSSLLISNYSIRTDNVIEDLGNFPIWNNDLFRRDSRYLDAYSRHAHILDFDSLRLGRKVIDENPKADSFEFGVINITEIGKERGNSIELQTIKKNDEYTNQKNDLFNSWLKMVRHSATIDNYPFVKIITDEQRPESWGADARDLCEIVHIDECSDMKLAMPLFALEDLIISLLLNKFKERYYKYRFERGDNTLPMYLYKRAISIINNYQKSIYNRFGYYKLNLQVEKGTQDSDKKDYSYFLMYKKIYSKRFSTDCFSDFFNEKSLRSKIGINDLDEFKNEKASFEEMMKENSYFFNDLTRKLKN